MAAPKRYAVEVNECKVMSRVEGRDWWVRYRQRFAGTGRITVEQATIIGDVVRVACDDKADAEHAARFFVSYGKLPKSAVKVVSERVDDSGAA